MWSLRSASAAREAQSKLVEYTNTGLSQYIESLSHFLFHVLLDEAEITRTMHWRGVLQMVQLTPSAYSDCVEPVQMCTCVSAQKAVSRACSGSLLTRTPHLLRHVSCALRVASMAAFFSSSHLSCSNCSLSVCCCCCCCLCCCCCSRCCCCCCF